MRPTALLLTATASLIVLAACGTDDGATGSDDTFGQGPPPTSAADSSTPVTPVSPAPDTSGDTTPDTPDNTDNNTPDDSEDPTTTADAAPRTTADVATTTPPSTAAEPAGPLPEPTVTLFEVGTFDQPVQVVAGPLGGRAYVVEQPGRVVATDAESTTVALDMTDLTDAAGERGLLGLAFHPTLDLAYVNFTNADGDTVIAEFGIDPTTGAFDRAAYREVLTVDQPFGNHNGGQLAFGPDDLLYIGLGDGGSADDPQRTSLDLTSRLGKLLRIDPVGTGDSPFTVPPDNPYVGVDGVDPTIWSSGLRNPWRFSFDEANGDLWIADVGQNVWEEVNHAPALDGADAGRGLSFGWSAFEGFERFNDDQPAEFPPSGHTPPRFVYDHGEGRCSVSGGAVARGEFAGDLTGWYVFGDYCSGDIWALDPTAPLDTPRTVRIAELDTLVAINVGPDGDLFAVSNGGTVVRIDAS